jgi:predicted RecB family nuclease
LEPIGHQLNRTLEYIRAIETNDVQLRKEMTTEILKYNIEDLKATWAVMQWLNGFS